MKLRHSFTGITLILLFQAVSIFSGSCQSAGIKRLSNKQFKTEALKENVVIIDVRTPDEFKDGHIEHAVLMDYLETKSFLKQIQSLDTSKSYLLYCFAGKRSLKAAELMIENGFKQVSDLKEGFSKWDGPTIKGSQ